ncbi:methyltransferase [Deminuibacter soli]|uniref:Methyltransferase domain-containing protein n=1 Tax=Deminuibacter soli TaxID=2291815 RepID=A0A3E1NG69_9BACT|nr:methyltransferase [Deminuibacter soli]RFM26788.1 methyltransferase domain-containing protein [Deminuibacter soli]
MRIKLLQATGSRLFPYVPGMKRVLHLLAGRLYRPLLLKYLSVTRTYTYKGISLLVPPEVFHPAFFFSTRLLLHYISCLQLEGNTFLELGAGSGLIALSAARKKALVTATDINPVAITFLQKNSVANRLPLQIIHSDLFEHIPQQQFDIIAINPPYYKKQPQTFAEHAWFCGENGEYFQRLFSVLPQYMHAQSTVLMILSDGCDIELIERIANTNNCTLQRVFTRQYLMEQNFIFKIESGSSRGQA